jgi:hypothetical protein
MRIVGLRITDLFSIRWQEVKETSHLLSGRDNAKKDKAAVMEVWFPKDDKVAIVFAYILVNLTWLP